MFNKTNHHPFLNFALLSFAVMQLFAPVTFAGGAGSGASDSQIITSVDANECNQLSGVPHVSVNSESNLDPAQAHLADDGGVWRVGSNRWDSNYEKTYQAWVKTEVNADFMQRFQLKVDCADATAMPRVIFARIYSLPILMTEGALSVSNATKTWSNVPTIADWNKDNWQQNVMNDQRFRKFLLAVSATVHIPGLTQNTYPVQVTDPNDVNKLSEFIQSGTVIMNDHHAEFVKEIDLSQFDPLIKMNSTSPAAVRALWVEPMDIEYPTQAGRGFANWDWAVNCGSAGWKHVDSTRMPGYSREQEGFNSFEHFSANQLTEQAALTEQKISQLISRRQSQHSLSSDDQFALTEAQSNKVLIQKAQLFEQTHPNQFPSDSFHNYIQLLAHGGTLPHVYQKFVMDDVDLIVARMVRRSGYVQDALNEKAKNPNVFHPGASVIDDFSTTNFDASDKDRLAREISMLNSQKDHVEVTEYQFSQMLFQKWIDIGNGMKANAFYYGIALSEDANGNLVSSDPNASLGDRWGFKWVQQRANDLKTQEASAQKSFDDANAKLQAIQSAQNPANESMVTEAENSAQSLYDRTFHIETSTSRLLNPALSSVRNAQNKLSGIKTELDNIQKNYGISAN